MDVAAKVLTRLMIAHFDTMLRRGHKKISWPHPTLNPRNGIQTVELPLEDYHEMARLATIALQAKGHDVTVVYDETDAVRAFVPDHG